MNQNYLSISQKNGLKKEFYKEGKLFEEYISNLFNKEYFYRIKWRKSEKFSKLCEVSDPQYPDLEMELVFGRGRHKFAVECKWRKDFINGKYPWARRDQIRAYRQFQSYKGIPVFVAIGIGGKPDSPEKLFLTPLDNIYMKQKLSESDLIPFERNPRQRFYYDYIQLALL